MNDKRRIKELIERLDRITAADEWGDDINPTQWTALSYLSRANSFSRSPSHVADFMTTTRGTVSQTLKALARKGLITEIRSEHDKRSISYSITEKGEKLFKKESTIEEAALQLGGEEVSTLLAGLEALARTALKQRGYKSFGVCDTCSYHRKEAEGGYCNLLNLPLSPPQTKQICHEHTSAK
ncbi:MarR family transcriptional regulator [Sneathiella sp. CAU 1612]|uniref:MarR family transcriptional regulator n=1 Tax=Sneathiella sedimenti TaxID=2816034 RepID=A0ABS3F979_9PROT|nr:MarR family transcriptional regulator [Sneathiella sedimenti]MBO0335077.1 MarR family transcriptional regulator [Sneathiella sedimenti]